MSLYSQLSLQNVTPIPNVGQARCLGSQWQWNTDIPWLFQVIKVYAVHNRDVLKHACLSHYITSPLSQSQRTAPLKTAQLPPRYFTTAANAVFIPSRAAFRTKSCLDTNFRHGTRNLIFYYIVYVCIRSAYSPRHCMRLMYRMVQKSKPHLLCSKFKSRCRISTKFGIIEARMALSRARIHPTRPPMSQNCYAG